MLRTVSWLVLAAALFSAETALAQGTSGTLPDPISSAELARYAERLLLSEEQMQAVQALHDQYREEFRQLREGRIARFLERMRELQSGGPMRMPARDKLEAFIEEWRKVSTQIRQTDERFLAQIATVLTDQQQPRLQRVVMARDRQRNSVNQMIGISSQPVDLSELALEVPMTAEEREMIDPVLAGYESRLTRQMRELSELSSMMFIDLYDAFEEAGLDENAAEDPEQMQRVMEVVQESFGRITARIREKANEIRTLNRRTIDQSRPMLSDRAAREILQRFVQMAYPQAAFALKSEALELCEMALNRDDLPPAKKEEIRSIGISHRAKREAMLEEAIELAEAQQNVNPFDPDRDQMREIGTKVGELTARAVEQDQEARRALRAVLGDDLWPDLQQRHAEKARERKDETTTVRSFGGGSVVESAQSDEDDRSTPGLANDEYLPGPISEYDVAVYADVLRLSEDERGLLENLHQQYKQRFESETSELVGKLGEAQRARWQVDPETGEMQGRGEQSVDRIFELRREAAESISTLDEAFFRDIDLTLFPEGPSPQLDIVRDLRDIERYGRGRDAMFGFGRPQSGPVNLFLIAREQRFNDPTWSRIEQPLATYADQYAAQMRKLYEIRLETGRRTELWQAEMVRRQQEDDFNPMELGMEYQERMRETQTQLSDSLRAVSELNDQTITALYDALDASNAHQLRRSFRERAYPRVYRDDSSPEKAIRSAMQLPELSSAQRSTLAEIAAEFRTRYAELSEKMVEHARVLGGRAMVSFESEDWQVFQEHQNAMARLRFDRNELNARTISRLRTTLSHAQIESIGGLPEPPDDRNQMWFMD